MKRSNLRVIGILILITAISFILIGIINFFISINNEEMPAFFFLLFVGFPMVPIGVIMILVSYADPVAKKLNESHVADDLGKELNKFVSDVKSAFTNSSTKEKITECEGCGASVEPNAKQCPYCGRKY